MPGCRRLSQQSLNSVSTQRTCVAGSKVPSNSKQRGKRMAAKKKREGQATEFLSHLYQDLPDGHVELRFRDQDGKIVEREWCSSLSRIEKLVMDNGDRASKLACYYGVAKRTDDSKANKKAKKEHILGTSALWADIDTAKHGWDLQNTAKALYDLPTILQPSALVCSGGGLHAYWLLETPIYFDHPDDVFIVEEANKALGTLVSGDRIFDITRVLRLPGSYNVRAKKQVDMVYFFHWSKKRVTELNTAALEFGKVLGPRGFVPPDKMPKEYRIARNLDVENVVRFTLGTKQSRMKKEDELWRNTRPGGGYPYYGINEAELLSTCNQYFALDGIERWNDRRDRIIDYVLAKVEGVMSSYPHDARHWDWDKEEDAIADKLDRWHERWAVLRKDLAKKARAEAKAAKAAA